jgi:hypothetical protein
MALLKANVIYVVRKTILDVASPLIVKGERIENPWDVDPAWPLAFPRPIGMSSDKINYTLVPQLRELVRSYKPSATFSTKDLKPDSTVSDVQDKVWDKVKPST